MTEPPALPLYYPGKSLADMEALLRRDYLTRSGWLESAEARLARRDGRPLPWFTYPAIAFLERVLPPGLSLFEYGGGSSTLYWAGRMRRVTSVDHDPAFAAFVRPGLPGHVEFRLVEEGAPLPAAAAGLDAAMPALVDPERSERTYRSGQLNRAFAAYALQILQDPPDSHDVVVVDGMARILCTWAAIRHFRRDGFIVFDNADRAEYRLAYDMLSDAGYRRIDFEGLGPVNPYAWSTAVFYRHRHHVGVRWFPAPAEAPVADPAPEPECRDALGIVVLGFNRPHHLQSVLESLRLQGRLAEAHVWIDGTQGRGEYAGANDESVRLARRYPVRELREHRTHLGIEKMMLDALDTMTRRYRRILVLKDDCFPVEGGVDAIEGALAEVADRPEVFSVYGHPFGTEPAGTPDFTRFQGWGWAAHADRVRALLPELRALFMLDEEGYRAEVSARMTDDVRDRLDRTPGRDVLKVLGSAFSWDSATAFLTAECGMVHRRTAAPVIRNTGISAGIGHFHRDTPFLRRPPFNMIPLSEAWAAYDTTTRPCPADRASYGLDALDLRIAEALGDTPPGFFIEIGAHDGVTQSNSVLLEARGWRGLLIEANPGSYARCVRARPLARVVHAACVAAPVPGGHVTVTDVGLMSMTAHSTLGGSEREAWIARGEGFARRPRQDIDVPATTMSAILDDIGVDRVDLLLLDVEGAEIDVLSGLDFARHAPRLIVAEDAHDEVVSEFLAARGYARVAVLLERRFTRDCLYRRGGGGPAAG